MNVYMIIGASGCIGYETAKWLLENYHHDRVVTVSRGMTEFPGTLKNASHETGDISSIDSIKTIIEKNKVTHILHCAALRTTECNADPDKARKVNVGGTANVINAAMQCDSVRDFTFISTAAVYNQTEKREKDVTEEAETSKYAPYVATKLESEEMIKEYSKESTISFTSLRPQILFGPSRSLSGSTAGITKCIKSAALNQSYSVPFSGRYSFHFTGNIGEIIGRVLTKPKNYSFEIFNLPGSSHDVQEFINFANSQNNESPQISQTENIYPFAISISHDKYIKFFGEISITPLNEALAATFRHFQNNRF